MKLGTKFAMEVFQFLESWDVCKARCLGANFLLASHIFFLITRGREGRDKIWAHIKNLATNLQWNFSNF